MKIFKQMKAVAMLALTAGAFQNCSQAMHSANSASSRAGSEAKTCGTNYAPGRAPLRLLSNHEYNNTVKDLLFTSSVATDLGIFEDTLAGPTGFINDTSRVTLTPLLIEKYWTAAGKLADELISTKGTAGGAYSRIAPCAVNVAAPAQTCYASVLRSLGLRAFRRPLSEAGSGNEYSRLMALMAGQGSFDEGLRTVIQAVLISPNFLFVPHASALSNVDGAVFPLNDFQMATRLSYFLWQTMPDAALLDLAAAGTLKANLDAQVERMLRDPKASRLTDTLMTEWAHIQGVDTLTRPGLSDALKQSMVQEVRMMFDSLRTEDTGLHQVLAGKSSYINKQLADHYEVPFTGADPAQFYKTDMTSVPRRGIFGTGLFLAISAHNPDQPSPVSRGKAIANNFACFEVPPPPPNVMADPADLAALPPNPTPFESLAAHRKNPVCASCHNSLDPYGLGLETFDGAGKWRTTYAHLGGKPIVQANVLPHDGNFATTAQMMNLLSQSAVIRSCSVRKIISIAVGRVLQSADDRCAAEAIGAAAVTPTAKFSDLIKRIASSRTFTMQTGEAQ